MFCPYWIEKDPDRERSLDGLGLDSVADAIAQELLPDLSVATDRARYFSFFCWALSRAGSRDAERDVHRWEVALALREARLDEDDEHKDTCRYVGRQRASSWPHPNPPRNPEDLYKIPALRSYVSALRNLGFVERKTLKLTKLGAQLARAYAFVVRPRNPSVPMPESACLSLISRPEQRSIAEALGIGDGRRARDGHALQRRETWLELKRHRGTRGLDPSLLEAYEPLLARRNVTGPRRALARAALWERLSLGLSIAFVKWLETLEQRGGMEARYWKTFGSALSRRAGTVPFWGIDLHENVTPTPEAAAMAVASLRKAMRLRARCAWRDELDHDESAWNIARDLCGSGSVKSRVERFRLALAQRHLWAKGEANAWIVRSTSGFKIDRSGNAARGIPTVARLHPYRLVAWGSLLADLEGSK